MIKSRRLLCMLLICSMICLTRFADCEAAGLEGKLSGGKNTKSAQVPSNSRPVLPKNGDLAVVVDGSDEQLVRMSEAYIIELLTVRGYRVVDEGKMKQIRAAAAQAKAARLALEGNVEGIMRISSRYSVKATIIASVNVGNPVENEFGLYTGTASVALLAVTSNGTKLGGKRATAKQVGYTEDETQQKALDAALSDALEQMI